MPVKISEWMIGGEGGSGGGVEVWIGLGGIGEGFQTLAHSVVFILGKRFH